VGNEEEKLLPETLLSFPQVGGLPGEGGAMHTFEVREEVGVVASEVRKEFRVFIEPQELTDDLDSEYFAVAESRSGSAYSEAPELSDAVVYEAEDGHDEGAKIHKKKTSTTSLWCYLANTERREVFSLAQVFTRNLHTGLATIVLMRLIWLGDAFKEEVVMAEPNAVLYDTDTTQEWLNQVNEWSWVKKDDNNWQKSGRCPRCKHSMDRIVGPEYVFPQDFLETAVLEDIDLAVPLRTRTRPTRVLVRCNCTSPHEGRPDNRSGCGSAGKFDGPEEWVRGGDGE
jgi:hypothetical protein